MSLYLSSSSTVLLCEAYRDLWLNVIKPGDITRKFTFPALNFWFKCISTQPRVGHSRINACGRLFPCAHVCNSLGNSTRPHKGPEEMAQKGDETKNSGKVDAQKKSLLQDRTCRWARVNLECQLNWKWCCCEATKKVSAVGRRRKYDFSFYVSKDFESIYPNHRIFQHMGSTYIHGMSSVFLFTLPSLVSSHQKFIQFHNRILHNFRFSISTREFLALLSSKLFEFHFLFHQLRRSCTCRRESKKARGLWFG